MKALYTMVTAIVCSFAATISYAAPMTFTFDLLFTDGPIRGTRSEVSLTIDGYTGAGVELFTNRELDCDEDPSIDNCGLMTTFDVVIDGIAFDYGDGDDPFIAVIDGSLVFVFFNSGDPIQHGCEFASPSLCIGVGGEPAPVVFRGAFDEMSTGYVDFDSFAPVPLPAAAWLFGSALLALGAVKRRKA